MPPATWQAEFNLWGWKKRKANNPQQHSPVELARETWPDAPLEFEADSGRAVGLLLARLAALDVARRVDRAALRAVALEKAAAEPRNRHMERKQTVLWW